MSITLHRGAGHPWFGDGDWDQMALRFSSIDLLDAKISEAEHKYWRVWIRDQTQAGAVMYKPSGIQGQWEDEPRMGTPRERCLGIKVGDQVYTEFTGRITQHRVTARETGRVTQTGCVLRVTPVVAKSTDAGNEYIGSNPWIDAAWFRPVTNVQETAS